MALTQRTGEMMQGAVITGGFLSALLAPWSSGLVSWVAHSPIGQWVSFPEGYDTTLLSAVTSAITYAVGMYQLRKVRRQSEDV